MFLVEKLSGPAKLSQDWHGAGPPHTDPGQNVWRAEGSEGQQGRGLGGSRQGRGLGGSRPGQAGSGPCTVLGVCCLPALPMAPAAARAQVQADALPETHPRALPHPCTRSPMRAGSPTLPPNPSSSLCLLDLLLALLRCLRGCSPPSHWLEGKPGRGGQAGKERGHDAGNVHLSST